MLTPSRRHIAKGEAAGYSKRYKCRIRDPWYAVPEQAPPPGFLTYLAGEIPRAAVNWASARATNNLHGVWWDGDAAGWTMVFHNWLTLLSVERIGRVYGGGVLKIEPGDARRILLPPRPISDLQLFAKVDRDLRSGNWERALDRVTELVAPPAVHRAARTEWKRLRAMR